LEAGMNGIITKPIKNDELRSILEKYRKCPFPSKSLEILKKIPAKTEPTSLFFDENLCLFDINEVQSD